VQSTKYPVRITILLIFKLIAKLRFTVPETVPDEASARIHNKTLIMDRKDVLSLYTPVVEAVTEHLRSSLKLLKDMTKAYFSELSAIVATEVIFTGGFSNSHVLRKALNEFPPFQNMEKLFPSEKKEEGDG